MLLPVLQCGLISVADERQSVFLPYAERDLMMMAAAGLIAVRPVNEVLLRSLKYLAISVDRIRSAFVFESRPKRVGLRGRLRSELDYATVRNILNRNARGVAVFRVRRNIGAPVAGSGKLLHGIGSSLIVYYRQSGGERGIGERDYLLCREWRAETEAQKCGSGYHQR
jgi:hypothetical protein